MPACTEIAIFRVKAADQPRALELSRAIFAEMNADGEVMTSFAIMAKSDDEEELSRRLNWASLEAAKEMTSRWPTFKSTKEFQGLVDKNIYFGHFLTLAE